MSSPTTFIFADNYRGFRETCFPIHQVNFMVGENSTGKTSIIDLVETFSYSPFWFLEPGFGDPESRSFTRHFLDLVSASSKSKKEFTIGTVDVSDGDDQSSNCGMFVTYVNFNGRPAISRISIVSGLLVKTIEGKLWLKKDQSYRIRECGCSTAFLKMSLEEKVRDLALMHKINYAFSTQLGSQDDAGAPILVRHRKFFFDENFKRERLIPIVFQSNLIELAPIRSRPKRTYDAPQTLFSAEGDHVPYQIKKFLSHADAGEEFKNFLNTIGADSRLFDSLQVRKYGSGARAPFELNVVLRGASLSLENVGYGVSQALPVLVEMFLRPRGTLFAVQQPEVHLHPRAQASIGDLVADLARKEGKIFLIETHSDFTIDRFRLNVRRKGKVKSQLLFFERTEIENTVVSIPIDEKGNLSEEQPDSYRDFFFNESLSLLS